MIERDIHTVVVGLLERGERLFVLVKRLAFLLEVATLGHARPERREALEIFLGIEEALLAHILRGVLVIRPQFSVIGVIVTRPTACRWFHSGLPRTDTRIMHAAHCTRTKRFATHLLRKSLFVQIDMRLYNLVSFMYLSVIQ